MNKMKLLTKAPRGTQDMLPSESHKWQFVENLALDTAKLYGFREIRVPTFEHTELFKRSVGDTTDVVQKEMFTFEDRGGRSLSLRPEGTAGTVRAALENGLLGDALPVKLSYVVSCFRNERPQAGRFKEFHQFGVEMFGAAAPGADAEVIGVANDIFEQLGIQNLELQINSIGCPECRAKYQQALKDYFAAHLDTLCGTCEERLEKNPMRLIDCKVPECAEIAKDAPVILDYICDECRRHFELTKVNLQAMGIAFVVNPRIVRGLDYYTRTVFEFVSNDLGAQSTVCGGGRYDGLVETLGGKPTPALGFAMGLERLLMILDKQGIELPSPQPCDLYIASIGEEAALKAAQLTSLLRKEGFFVEFDTVGRSLKAQMKYADKLGAKLSMVIGDNEVSSCKAKLKDMSDGETKEVEFKDLPEAVYQKHLKDLADEVTDEEIQF